MRKKRWVVRETDPEHVSLLSRELSLLPITARILLNRGMTSVTQARAFLSPSRSDLFSPLLLPDIERGVERVVRALSRGEGILIYGDYDVDGITATALYCEFLRGVNGRVGYYIPHRMSEGYGLNEKAIRRIKDEGYSVIITADCGTTSYREIELAQSLGVDVIVVDHHQVPDTLPPAVALINPYRSDSSYPFKGLCSVGLALKFVEGLFPHCDGGGMGIEGFLDLVALGTIADVAPLTGENRYFVREGLALLSGGRRMGIRALKEVAGLDGKEVGVGTVGFMMAPRINAAGRLSSAMKAVDLLMATSYQEALRIAQDLDATNRERQRCEEIILREAEEKVAQEVDLRSARAIVLASHEWHPGVIGIIASRLAEKYSLPVVLISLGSDGVGRGSARSIPSLDLYRTLCPCAPFLEKFGGHRSAAGLTIRRESISPFRERFEKEVALSLSPEEFSPVTFLDAEADLFDIGFRCVNEMSLLSPFGTGNPEPTLLLSDVTPLSPRIVGTNHVKFKVKKTGPLTHDAIGFGMGHHFSLLTHATGPVDLAVTPIVDRWGGEERIQLRVKEIRVRDEK